MLNIVIINFYIIYISKNKNNIIYIIFNISLKYYNSIFFILLKDCKIIKINLAINFKKINYKFDFFYIIYENNDYLDI